MTWLKTTSGAILAAIGMFLIAMSVANSRRQSQSAKKWKKLAVDGAEADVKNNLGSAAAALSQAKLFDARAKQAKEAAKKRLDKIGERDEDMGTIISGWSKSKRLRNKPNP